MKKRIIKVIAFYSLLLLIFFSYYYINKYTGFYFPCFFREITGYQCPGCGIRHLFFELLKLNFSNAFYANPLVFIYLPFFVLYCIYATYIYIFNKKNYLLTKIPDSFWIVMLIITIVYGIVRNF